MNITIISHNYAPEDSGIGLYSTDMAEFLAKENDVKVITAFPYYPQWKIADNYKDKPSYLQENINEVEVNRYKMFTPKNPGFLNRIIQMFSFLKGSFRNIKKIDESNIIIVVVPFTFSIFLGKILSRKHKVPLWVHVQDFEFDAALETGLLSKIPFLPSILSWFEKKLFKNADEFSSISMAMLEKLESKTKQKAHWFPNWINEEFINPTKAKPHPYFENGKKNVLYSGNIGAKQDWETYIQLVKSMKNDPNVHFVLIGDGAKREELIGQLQNEPNFSYYPPVDFKDLNDVLCSADVHLLLQKPEVVDTVMPSKLLAMMASGKPSLISGNAQSGVKTHLENGHAGLYVSENTIEILRGSIKELLNETSDWDGKKSRQYVIERFSKNSVLEKFEQDLKSAVNRV